MKKKSQNYFRLNKRNISEVNKQNADIILGGNAQLSRFTVDISGNQNDDRDL